MLAQDTIEHIKIDKRKIEFYRCQNPAAKDWILVIEDKNHFFLINARLLDSEIAAWFKKFHDSQNLFKSGINAGELQVLNFKKDNDPRSLLDFYYQRGTGGDIVLTTIAESMVYIFRKVEVEY